jgi:hypothetical protein
MGMRFSLKGMEFRPAKSKAGARMARAGSGGLPASSAQEYAWPSHGPIISTRFYTGKRENVLINLAVWLDMLKMIWLLLLINSARLCYACIMARFEAWRSPDGDSP